MAKLTARAVEAMKPSTVRQEIPDALLRGLYLIVQPSGVKSWAVRYRVSGKTRKHTLGSFPALDLKAARELGAEALRKAATGNDPAQEKKIDKANTVKSVVAEFLDLHGRNYRPGTLAEVTRILNRFFIFTSNSPISSITRAEIRERLDRIARATPIEANRTFSVMRRLFNWAVEREIIPVSPMANLKKPATEWSRDRVLSDEELKAIWHAAGTLNYPHAAIVKLLILTGARRSEVTNMEWSELDLKHRQWQLPGKRAKNGRPHLVPLSPQVMSVLESLPRTSERFVFSLNGKPVSDDLHRAKKRLDAALPPDTQPWVIHDFRRTFATRAAELGVAPHIVEACVNHVSGRTQVAGIYNRAQYFPEKAKAMMLWGQHVATITRIIELVA